eukprot:2116411-Pyramimonas_sp.AAC.1
MGAGAREWQLRTPGGVLLRRPLHGPAHHGNVTGREPITGGKRAYSRCGSQSHGGREHLPGYCCGILYPRVEGGTLELNKRSNVNNR